MSIFEISYFLTKVFLLLSIFPTTEVFAELIARLSPVGPTGSVVRYTITNVGINTDSFIPWGTPFDTQNGLAINNPFTIVNANGAAAPFRGILAKRVVPEHRYEVQLDPGESKEIDVDVVASYGIQQIGIYTVTARNPEGFELEWTSPITVDIRVKPIIPPQDAPPPIQDAGAHLPSTATNSTNCSPYQYLSCDGAQKLTVANAYILLAEYVPQVPCWSTDDPGDSMSETWFGDDGEDLDDVRDAYHNIYDIACRLGDFEMGTRVNCSCDDDTMYAYVHADDEYHTIYLCHYFWTASLVGLDSKMGVLVHEMSHFEDVHPGTYDYAYGCTKCKNLALNTPFKARRNADNYEYLVEGSCTECEIEHTSWLADGYCDQDDDYNTEPCGYDNGDCCQSTCTDATFICGENGYQCIDPGAPGDFKCSQRSCSELGISATNSGSDEVCGDTDIGGCSGRIDFKDAADFCKADGMRLCTFHELLFEETANTGCGYDSSRIWSITPCPESGEYWTARGEKGGTLMPTCLHQNDSARARCCSDVHVDDCAPPKDCSCSTLSCENLGLDPGRFGSAKVCAASQLGDACSGEVEHDEAIAYCESPGLRLCRIDELLYDEARDTGCNYDTRRLWSSTRCRGTDMFFTARGQAQGNNGNTRPRCDEKTEKFRARCCADVDVHECGCKDAETNNSGGENLNKRRKEDIIGSSDITSIRGAENVEASQGSQNVELI